MAACDGMLMHVRYLYRTHKHTALYLFDGNVLEWYQASEKSLYIMWDRIEYVNVIIGQSMSQLYIREIFREKKKENFDAD